MCHFSRNKIYRAQGLVDIFTNVDNNPDFASNELVSMSLKIDILAISTLVKFRVENPLHQSMRLV